MSENQASKKALRTKMTQMLSALTSERRRVLSQQAQQLFLASDHFAKASSLMVYHADSTEVDTEEIIRTSLASNKKLCLPRTDPKDRSMGAFEIKSLETDTEVSRFGFREPKQQCQKVSFKALDLILVPGRAFDAKGNRLGRGAGYYDRFLAKVSDETVVLGLAFEFQIVDDLPVEAHDRTLNGVITESRIILISSK